jgi:hypothetical protein
MEDVLDLYQTPYDPDIPMICMDEKPYQLLGDVREPLPMKSRSCKKIDHEYKRNGTCSIFLFCEPLTGKARADVSEHRTREDWAHQIHRLLTVDYPHARKIRLVMDQLNTHAISSLYVAFPPAQARALASRLEIHHTPKHGSWLNIAECYLSVLSRECLNRRIPDLQVLRSELCAWNSIHDSNAVPVNWRFTSPDARIRLRSLYPVVL